MVGEKNTKVLESVTPPVTDPCIITDNYDTNTKNDNEDHLQSAILSLDKPPEIAPLPEQAALIENSGSAMPGTAVPFDISTIITLEGVNNSGDGMEMVDAVDHFNISELHIP